MENPVSYMQILVAPSFCLLFCHVSVFRTVFGEHL